MSSGTDQDRVRGRGRPAAPSAAGGARTATRRHVLEFAGAVLAVVLLVVIGVLVDRGHDKPSVTTLGGVDPHPSAGGGWLSGASGQSVADGALAAWRGRPVDLAGTWADNNAGMVQIPQLRPGGEYGSWDKSIDVAIGAIDGGETWARAASGAYDQRWRQSLTNLREVWGSRSGTVYIRFAHEMNGDWYPWKVNAGNYQDFISAWKRFRALQQQIFPASKLVFCVNRESIGADIDWRTTFPGAHYVDVLGVDYYNHYPFVSDQAGWNASMDDRDDSGAPKGLQAYLDFARGVGLPLAVPEWSGIDDDSAGDSPAYILGMHDFFTSHAGGGPGQLLYEIQFNCDMDNGKFQLYGADRLPASAAEYRKDF